MTPEQKSLYIEVLQFGFSTGSRDRFDALRGFVKAYPGRRDEAIAAAAAFERGCCYCPEQAEHLRQMSDQQFADWVFKTGIYVIR